jgi:hypothetical protein
VNKRITMLVIVALFVVPKSNALSQSNDCVSASATVVAPSDVQKITDVKTIYVAPLGTVEGSELVRQKIINRLLKSGIVTVTEDAEHADATLTGTSEVNHRHSLSGSLNVSGGFVRGRTRYSAESVIRLVGRNKTVLWSDEVSTSKWLFASRSVKGASSNVADKLVKRLVEAIVPPAKQVATEKAASISHY